ncbi:MAG: hypothetical protein M1813_000268 [Trichoglossum hirsutum]|nr:MAG: hypothetical protein M1813_000268 [Trichoglossum hirsutum]
MPDQGTEKHSEEADITRDRHPPQIQDNPPVPTRTVRLPLTLERPRENAGQTQVIPASTEPSHSTRKRAAPLSVGGDNGYEADPGSFSGPLSGDSASQVCLCQPEPKIPRPRNAFILFRQHHHAAVVAQHPGLSNPEISKIIGEQWRDIPAPEKNQWKNLAEEEKFRHQQQYPDYKYQPRRNSRKGLALLPSVAPSPEEFSRCPKCGGRSLVIPSAPSPSLGPHAETPGISPSPLIHSSGSSNTSNSSRGLPLMNSPRSGGPSAGNRMSQTGVPQPNMGALPLGSLREQPEEEALTPLTPDSKRRRFNRNPAPNISGPITRSVANRIEGTVSRAPYPMGPPPRPHVGSIAGSSTPSITSLAPLQTTAGDSVKAMVMTIPYINKIKVISRISPPLSPPGPLSPPHQVRGSIIAVDGNNAGATDKLFRWLEEALRKGDEYAVETFESPSNPFESVKALPAEQPGRSRDVQIEECPHPQSQSQQQQQPRAPVGGDSPYFVAYLNSIVEWHRCSEKIVYHVTHLPRSPAEPQRQQPHLEPQPHPSEGTPPPPPPPPPPPLPPPPAPDIPPSPSTSPHPIALINRYILSRSDQAASHVPINDRYAPIDHWQWMATLWRGCVGPDILIYVKDDCTGDEVAQLGAVEMRTDAATIVVRRRAGGGGYEERALRRLRFEVGEIARGEGGAGW